MFFKLIAVGLRPIDRHPTHARPAVEWCAVWSRGLERLVRKDQASSPALHHGENGSSNDMASWRSVMRNKIDELLTAYDEKRISRRELIGALLIASVTAPLAAASQQKPANSGQILGVGIHPHGVHAGVSRRRGLP